LWALLAPLAGGVLAGLLWVIGANKRMSEKAAVGLSVAALVVMCSALLAQATLFAAARAATRLEIAGTTLSVTAAGRVGMLAADVALLCALFVAWRPMGGSGSGRRGTIVLLEAVALTASLLAGALLVGDGTVAALCLLGAALPVAVAAALSVDTGKNRDGNEPIAGIRGLAGGLKHLGLASVGTALMIVGLLLLARYPFNLERTDLLQFGFGLLAVGVAVRVGSMPWAAAFVDLIAATPAAAIMALGAALPVVLVASIRMMEPVQAALTSTSPTGRQVALGLGAIGGVLAGVRALSAAVDGRQAGTRSAMLATLVGTGVALQLGWTLFGVMSASAAGTTGATLLALNLGLVVPLGAVAVRRGGTALAVSAGSLLGLPPFGGFVGMALVAQAAVQQSGAWLALLLFGTVLQAAAWLQARARDSADEEEDTAGAFAPGAPLDLLVWVLVAAQVGLFVASVFLARVV
jgi:hypothetical protein